MYMLKCHVGVLPSGLICDIGNNGLITKSKYFFMIYYKHEVYLIDFYLRLCSMHDRLTRDEIHHRLSFHEDEITLLGYYCYVIVQQSISFPSTVCHNYNVVVCIYAYQISYSYWLRFFFFIFPLSLHWTYGRHTELVLFVQNISDYFIP